MKDYEIKGMHCAACIKRVEDAVKKVKGVKKASVNLATNKLYVFGRVNEAELKKALDRAGGYTLNKNNEKDDEARLIKVNKKKTFFSWGFTLPIAIFMIVHMFLMDHVSMRLMFYFDVIYILFSFPVIFYFGFDVIKSGSKSLFYLTFNMDSLIMLGTLVAFITGPLSFFMNIENYAAIAAMIMAFHLTGRYVEAKAKGKSSKAIKKLLTLEAKTANVLKEGLELKVSTDKVLVGDVLIIRPGEKVPVDGIIISGESSIDESMMTGESMPVDKKKGDSVIGGSINEDGVLRIKATKVGKDTFLNQIIKLVEQAQSSKVPIQEYADKITRFFVPVVFVVMFLTVLSWLVFPEFMKNVASFFSFIPWINPEASNLSLALFAGIAVLVIACPCALGLATPTTLMVSLGLGANNGVLVRKGEAIQTLKESKIFVFDKTGTITKGKPEVTDILCFDILEKDLLFLAGSVENNSAHPLAKAVVSYVLKKKIKIDNVKNFNTIRGKGLTAIVKGDEVAIGNKKLFSSLGIDFEKYESQIKKIENEGKTIMLVAKNKKIIGLVGLADNLKDDAIATIKKIKSFGIRTVLLTGDNKNTAYSIAKKVGINEVIADVLPDEKADVIKKLQKEGIVTFIGDGINDAPALKQANTSIAIGTGTDVAIETADIVLVKGDLVGVLKALNLSKVTFKKIKQNLFWAFFYNVVAIPLAIFGILHPVIAEIAMASSSISVVSNANLLRGKKI